MLTFCSNLTNNNLTGHLVRISSFFYSLRKLSLAHNHLDGKFNELSRDLCSLPDLAVLDLSDNAFTGFIPRCYSMSATVAYFRMAKNQLSGSLSDIFRTSSLIELSATR